MVVACAITYIYNMYAPVLGKGIKTKRVETLPDPVVGPDARNQHRHKAGLTAMLPRTEYLVNALTE